MNYLMTFHKDPVQGVFQRGPQSRLECDCQQYKDNTLMCQHIGEVLKRGVDAKTLRLENWDQYPDGYVTEIVLFSSDVKTIAPVLVTPWHNSNGELDPQVLFTVLQLVEDGEYEIGFLMPGEGRLVLRNMIVSILQAEYATAQCAGEWHGGYDFGPRDEKVKNTNDAILLSNVFSIMNFDECLKCRQALDLSPDIDPNPPWKK